MIICPLKTRFWTSMTGTTSWHGCLLAWAMKYYRKQTCLNCSTVIPSDLPQCWTTTYWISATNRVCEWCRAEDICQIYPIWEANMMVELFTLFCFEETIFAALQQAFMQLSRSHFRQKSNDKIEICLGVFVEWSEKASVVQSFFLVLEINCKSRTRRGLHYWGIQVYLFLLWLQSYPEFIPNH